jgi:hypothetical protein
MSRGSHRGPPLRTLRDTACRAATRYYSRISWCRGDRTARSTPCRTEADTRPASVNRPRCGTGRAVARIAEGARKHMPPTTSNTRIPGQVGMSASRGSFRLPLRLDFLHQGYERGGLYAPGSSIPLALGPTLQVHLLRRAGCGRNQQCLCIAKRNIEADVSAIQLVLALSNQWERYPAARCCYSNVGLVSVRR